MTIDASHTHDDSQWRLPGLAWAPEGDQTVSTRMLAAAKDQCETCLVGLTAEAAQSGDTLAVVILLAEHLLEQPAARRCVPAPALQDVFDRIGRMGNPEKSTVVGMLRTFTDQQRHKVATGCAQVLRDYITGVYEITDAILAQRQQQPWWMKRQ